MARLGDEVYDWNVDQLTDWLRCEGLDDCVEVFIRRRIDGLKLLNLNDSDLRNLHVSKDSGKKLSKVIEKFKKRKKGKFDRMFGNTEAHVVTAKKPSSFSHDEDDSDEGWGTDEWDSGSGEEDNVSSGDGEYLEPEDDLTQSTGGSPLRTEPSVFQTGVVAQLREGIAQSLRRDALQHQSYQAEEDEEDIYDVPPEEEEPENEDLYEEPSDSSGGAVVVRPPSKPPRVENGPAYLPMRQEESQDTYEAPIEGEDISQSPSNHQRFIPTQVQPRLQDMNSNDETYDVPEFTSDDDQYEVAPQSPEAPPPRPPKMTGKPASPPSQGPARPPKQQPPASSPISSASPRKTVFCKPPQSRQVPQEAQTFPGNSLPQQRGHLPKTNNYPPRQPLPSQGVGSRHFPNKPTVEPKQRPPAHSRTIQPESARQPKSTFSAQGTTFQGIPKQPELSSQPKPKPKPSPLQSRPLSTEEKRPPLAPKAIPKPLKPMDPTKRNPAPPPGMEPTRKISGQKTGPPDSPVPRKASDPPSPGRLEKNSDAPKPPPSRHELPRKVSDPPSPKRFDQKTPVQKPQIPVSTVDAGRVPPRPQGGRGGPPPLPPDSPKKFTSGLQTKRSGPLPATPGQERLSQQSHSDPPLPPRPPKTGASQTALAQQRKLGVPLPHLNTNSLPSSRDAKEQSSGSSLESSSADEPVVPLPSGNKQRGLPPTPVEKSPLDIMKEAPWFHGSVNRKISETNLRASRTEGAFLVRNSTNNPNEYSLSLLHAGQIRHLKIPKKDNQFVLGTSGIKKFDNIIDLISYYRQNEVDLANGGKTKLTVHAPNISR